MAAQRIPRAWSPIAPTPPAPRARPPPTQGAARSTTPPSRLQQHLSLRKPRSEVAVRFGSIGEREHPVDAHVEPAILDPAEEVVRARLELGAREREVRERGTVEEKRAVLRQHL